MKRIHVGNRVFTEKHGQVKLAHGPYSGHVRPLVRYLNSFDGSHYYRMVSVPHELAKFDRSMWAERRDRVTKRIHTGEMAAASYIDEVPNDGICDEELPSTPRQMSMLDTDCGVALYYDEHGRLSAASCGDENPCRQPVKPSKSSYRPCRKDWVRSARLMC